MDPFREFLRRQEKAWLDRRQQWALQFLDHLMLDIARYNTGSAPPGWMEKKLVQYSLNLAEKAEEVRRGRQFLPLDPAEIELWLQGFQHYRFGLRELEVYLSRPEPALASQARHALTHGSMLLARAMARAYTRLGF